jgi:peroxin-4
LEVLAAEDKGEGHARSRTNRSQKTGKICLDLLNTKWSPAYTLETTLEAIAMLLRQPANDEPFNIDVARLGREGDAVAVEALERLFVGLRAD